MDNALIGIPLSYNILATSGWNTGSFAAANAQNDEPGLICQTNSIANGGTATFDIDLTSQQSVNGVVLLGLDSAVLTGWTCRVQVYTTAIGSGLVQDSTVALAFSTNRSADDAKTYLAFAAVTGRYIRITLGNASGASGIQRFWRVLPFRSIQPATNIEVGASVIIDDRSERRYSRAGGRVIDPTVICPAFQGQWPWITAAEAHQIRKMIYQRGGSYPGIFVLDPADTSWGEDFLFYGDFEKSLGLDLDNDDNNMFKFSIVSIAP
jgi:hypothetical protein